MNSDTKEKQIGVRLTAKDMRRIKKLCEKLEMGASAVVRRAIRELAVLQGLERP